MRKFELEIGYGFRGVKDVVESGVVIEAANELELIKRVREMYPNYCSDDVELVEWVESSDNWDRVVDDVFLSELIVEEDDAIYLTLAEDIYFECKEIGY